MSAEDRAKQALETLSRALSNQGKVRSGVRELRSRLGEARIRLMDEVVSTLARRPINTQSRSLFKQAAALAAEALRSDPPRPAPPVARSEPAKPEPAAPKAEPARASGPAPAAAPTPARSAPTSPRPAAAPSPAGTNAPARGPAPAPRPSPAPEAAASTPGSSRPNLPGVSNRGSAGPGRNPAPSPPAGQPAPQNVGRAPTPAPAPGLKYGIARLVLMARDPEWLYVYWELEADEVGLTEELHLVLIDPDTGDRMAEARAAAAERHAAFRRPGAGRRYAAIIDRRGRVLVRSSVVEVPSADPAPIAPVRFVAPAGRPAAAVAAEILTAPLVSPPRVLGWSPLLWRLFANRPSVAQGSSPHGG